MFLNYLIKNAGPHKDPLLSLLEDLELTHLLPLFQAKKLTLEVLLSGYGGPAELTAALKEVGIESAIERGRIITGIKKIHSIHAPSGKLCCF